MRRRGQRAVAIVVALALVLALLFSLLVVMSESAAAHAELQRSAPRPTQVVGGLVNRVDVEFRQPIRPHEINRVQLITPAGDTIQTALTYHGRLVRARFASLTEPGVYQVVWGLVDDSDGDWTEEQFPFTYQPDAPEPEWLPEPVADDGSGVGRTVLLLVVIVVTVAAGGWLFWPRRRGGRSRRRR